MNTQCEFCGLQIISGQYVGDVIGGICQGHTYHATPIISRPIVISTDSTTPPCPLTNSSHEKALVRVVDRDKEIGHRKFLVQHFIQVLCACGHTISENEVKPLTRN